jgi:glycosyltransferase involved in cell wall biosynthesis
VFPTRIVCDAEAARQSHVRIGYRQDRMVVIPNGFDLDTLHPDPDAHQKVCAELGLSADALLVGMAARFHPDKDHRNFIQATAVLHVQMPEVHFLLWGRGMDRGNTSLMDWIDSENLHDVIHLLGFRDDTPMLTAALDVATLSSSGEAFPMALGEAMACGIPCAATDVGDIAEMLDGVGKVVPPRDPSALAQAWLELLRLPVEERQRLGEIARRKVMEHYEIRQTAAKYAHLYRDIIENRQR